MIIKVFIKAFSPGINEPVIMDWFDLTPEQYKKLKEILDNV